MKKNRLLLEQKRFLSFSNYKNIINDLLSGNNNKRIIINSRESILNLTLFKEIKNSQINRNSNLPIFRSKSNRLLNNNIRLFPSDNNKLKINVSSNFNFDNGKSQRNYYNFKNALNYFSHINKLLKTNRFKIDSPKKLERTLDNSVKINQKKIINKNIINEETFFDFINTERYVNNNDNNNKNTLIKTKSEKITSRKLSKELFRNDINGIIVKRKGEKKVKYKIIGTLTTEPTLKSHNKTHSIILQNKLFKI